MTVIIPHTSCRDCVFATYDDKTQIGCSLNRLAKYGDSVIEVMDDEKEFYVIDGHKCQFLRPREWAEDKVDLVAAVNKECEIQYQVAIWAHDSLLDIEKTVNSLMEQKIRPIRVVVIRPYDNPLKSSDIINMLMNSCLVKWTVQNMINDDDDNNPIDQMVIAKPYPFYAVFNAGFKVPKLFFSDLNEKINNELLQFAVILPNSEKNGMVVSTIIHKFYQGNLEKPLIEKIRSDKCAEMIMPIHSLFNYFPK